MKENYINEHLFKAKIMVHIFLNIKKSFSLMLIILFVQCTKNELPKLTTDSISEITQISAQINGTVIEEGEPPINYRGFCWNTSPNPTIDDSKSTNGIGDGNFNGNISGLQPNTQYYVRAYATNTNGTTYGNELTFTTLLGSMVDSRDGAVYKIIKIGTQTWMAENLKATTLNDGTAIPLVTDATEWSNQFLPAYCYYLNDYQEYGAYYGCLYNWFTVTLNNICPVGWHVPSKTEFKTLLDHVGGSQIAGIKLKELGTNNWMYPNEGATNESGFTALPGGYRTAGGTYGYAGIYGNFWSSTEDIPDHAFHVYLNYNSTTVYLSPAYMKSGFSIRCVKDE